MMVLPGCGSIESANKSVRDMRLIEQQWLQGRDGPCGRIPLEDKVAGSLHTVKTTEQRPAYERDGADRVLTARLLPAKAWHVSGECADPACAMNCVFLLLGLLFHIKVNSER